MKRTRVMLTIVVVAIVTSASFLTSQYLLLPGNQVAGKADFYVGVECGYNNVTLCKALIDKVKDYTNFFIIGSTEIVMNASSLDEICDYANAAGLHFSVYFSAFLSYPALGEDNPSSTFPSGNTTMGGYQSLPIGWLKNATLKYGDSFLGTYVFDEPGGNQLDGSTQRVVNVASDCQSVADAFVGNVSAKIQPYLDANVTTFTSDYGLYWFDYKAGYDFVLAELGGSACNRQMQISLCRGAANVQGKDWGIMITHVSVQEQIMESGLDLYNDLVLSYDSGAKYAAIFDYAETGSNPPKSYQPSEYGILQDDHFEALKNFWKYVQQNPNKQSSLKADAGFVLPQDFGFGLRGVQDNIWGIFAGNSSSQAAWTEINNCLSQYGSRLDIMFDDSDFNGSMTEDYSTLIQSNSFDTE